MTYYPMIGLLFIVHQAFAAINLISEFPRSINIFKGDKVSFSVDRFLNGSDTDVQAFPRPTIDTLNTDLIVHSFNLGEEEDLSQCYAFHGIRGLVFITLCSNSRLFYHSYLPTLERKQLIVTYIPSDVSNIEFCSNINSVDDTIFVTCMQSGAGAYLMDLVLLVYEVDLAASKLKLGGKIVLPGFIQTNEKFIPMNLVIQESPNKSYRLLVCQDLRPNLNVKSTSSKIMILDYDKLTKKLTEVFMGDTGSKGINKAEIAGTEYVYIQEIDTGNLIACKTEPTNFECDHKNPISLGLTLSEIWTINFNPISLETRFYILYRSPLPIEDTKDDSPSFYISNCRMKYQPIDVNVIGCVSQKVYLSSGVVDYGFSLDFILDNNLNRLLITFHDKSDSFFSSLQGYLSASVVDGTSQYTDLSSYKASYLSPLNITSYVMQRGTFLYLLERRDSYFTIIAPVSDKRKEVFLSSYNRPNDKELSEQSDNSYIIRSFVYKVEDPKNFTELLEIAYISLYNNGLNYFGYNSKLILGNNANLRISLEGHDLPVSNKFVSSVNLVADKIDDIDISYLQLMKDGSIVALSDKLILKIFKCGLSMLGELQTSNNDLTVNCTCLFEEDVKDIRSFGYQTWNIKKVEMTNIGVFIIGFAGKFNKREELLMRITIVWLQQDEDTKEYKTIDVYNYLTADAECDVWVAFLNLRLACSLPSTTSNPNMLVLGDFSLEKNMITLVKNHKIDFANFGVLSENYRNGKTWFLPGSIQKIMSVNNHEKDVSIMEIDFEGIESDRPMTLYRKIPISNYFGDALDGGEIEICPTFSTVFVFSKSKGKVYGVNIDLPTSSYLEVPINGDNRIVLEMRCSNYQESFQLIVKDTNTENLYLMSYYGFDGTQCYKKQHSEILIEGIYDGFSMASILEDEEGLLLTFLYDSGSLFYNSSLLIDLRGPVQVMNTSNLVPGVFEFTAEAFNDFSSSKRILNVIIEEPTELNVDPKEISELPVNILENTTLETYISWNGPLFNVTVTPGTVGESWIEITNRLEPKEHFEIDEHYELLDVANGVMFFKDTGSNHVFYYNQEQAKLLEISLKESQIYCKGYEVFYSKNSFYLILMCGAGTKHEILIAEINQQTMETTQKISTIVPFAIRDIEADISDDELLVAFMEQEGKRIGVWLFQLSDLTKEPQSILVQATRPGGMILFAYAEFDSFIVDGAYGLVILSPQQSYYRVYSLDFAKKTLAYSFDIFTSGKTPVSIVDCDIHNSTLICITGGAGIYLEQHTLTIGVNEKGVKIINNQEPEIVRYRVPGQVKYTMKRLKILDGYFILNGIFKEIGKEEEHPVIFGFIWKTGDQEVFVREIGDKYGSYLAEYPQGSFSLYYHNQTGISRSLISEYGLRITDLQKAQDYYGEVSIDLEGFSKKTIFFYLARDTMKLWTLQTIVILVFCGLVTLLLLITWIMYLKTKRETERIIEMAHIKRYGVLKVSPKVN